MNHSLAGRTIVLLGIGHTNAHVLRKWCMSPIPDARLVCVSDFPVSTYSGMLPGVLAGDYDPDHMRIDLVKLCAAADALLIREEAVGMDLDRQRLLFRDRPPLAFDVLSVGIGSMPTIQTQVADDAPLVAIKPMQTFLQRIEQQLQPTHRTSEDRRIDVAIVGGGVAGVEVALTLPRLLLQLASRSGSTVEFALTLIQRNDDILPNRSAGLRKRALAKLSSKGVALRTGRAVERVAADRVVLCDGHEVPADLVVWATGAAAPGLLSSLGLPTDQRGFLLTDRTLKTIADAPVFAVGDSGTMHNEHLPKAGVYAVRQGPILWENLRRILDGRPLKRYRPQRRFLKLLNCGDRTALGEYGPLSFQGKWVWSLKDWIDTRFVEKFQNPPRMEMEEAETPMRCRGCGSKLAADDLFAVLADVEQSEAMPVALADFDDAAVMKLGDNDVALTTDFFPMPLDDAWISGRIAALHAMSDIYAMGAQPTAAMGIVTIQPGRHREQQQLLTDLLQGCLREFHAAGAALVGGHTTEGPETTIGFSVMGQPWGDRLCRKGFSSRKHKSPGFASDNPMRAGDVLLLTKRLGTGVLLAAHHRAECDAQWYESLRDHLLSSVGDHARLAWELGAEWMTDVSGFGLSGHLLELLRGQPVSAEIELARVPLLPGCVELSTAGIASSLFPANRQAGLGRRELAADISHHPHLPLLFDPQTCGGLLIVLPEATAAEFIRRCDATRDRPVVIGRIVADADPGRLRIVNRSD